MDDPERPIATDLRLREFTMADYEAVAELWRRAGLWMRPSDTAEQVALKLARDPDLFLVACADGEYGRRDDGRLGRSPSLRLPPGDRPAAGSAGGWPIGSWTSSRRRFRAKGALKAKLQIMVGNDPSAAFFAARGYPLETDCLPWGKELVAGGAPDDWKAG